MSIIWAILGLFGLALLGFVVFALVKIRGLSKPTTGPRIPTFPNPRKALLVVDIQEEYTGTEARKPFPFKGSTEMVARVNEAISVAVAKNMPVAYVTHAFENTAFFRLITGNRSLAGQPGTKLDSRIKNVSAHHFTKGRSDSFSNPELQKFLESAGVNEVFIVGLDAVHCVLGTAKGALNRGFKVGVISDCLLTSSKKSWAEIFDLYSQHGITVLSSTEFAALI